jgi:hypothetical protein
MPSPRPRSTRQAQAGVQYAFGAVARTNPIVALWRWRYELAGATGLAAPWVLLGPVAAAALTAGVAAALIGTAMWPQGRRYLTARAWCIITPHRVRIGCAQAWIHSRAGKIPAVLRTTSQPFGERVLLWCRAGTSVDDLSSANALLAAACWADDVRVARHPRYAHLVTLDVIRVRPPMAGRPRAASTSLAVLPLSRPAGGGESTWADGDATPRPRKSALSGAPPVPEGGYR